MRRTPAECQYQVMMFAVLTQASLFFLFSCCFFVFSRVDRQTEPGGCTSPAVILGWVPRRKTSLLLTFFEAFPYLQLYFTQSSGLFHQMVLLLIMWTGFFFQQHAAISNYFGSSLFECQRLKKTTNASCWALSCKWHLTAWVLQLPATLQRSFHRVVAFSPCSFEAAITAGSMAVTSNFGVTVIKKKYTIFFPSSPISGSCLLFVI